MIRILSTILNWIDRETVIIDVLTFGQAETMFSLLEHCERSRGASAR